MGNEPIRRVARIDQAELADLPGHWSARERGRHLRRLLRGKGIDAGRVFRIDYYPQRRCWLLTQDLEAGAAPAEGPADEVFFAQVMKEFRRAGVVAWAAQAARSSHFARSGREYRLPDAPREVTPAELAAWLQGPGAAAPPARFDGEGGWGPAPSTN